MAVLAPCIVCEQACEKHERNADGTYAHDNCLRLNQTKPYSAPAPQELVVPSSAV